MFPPPIFVQAAGCPFMRLTQSEQIPCLSCWEIEIAYSKKLNFLICLKSAMKFLLQSLCATGCPFRRQMRSSEILSQVATRPSLLKMAITSTYSAFVFVCKGCPFKRQTRSSCGMTQRIRNRMHTKVLMRDFPCFDFHEPLCLQFCGRYLHLPCV